MKRTLSLLILLFSLCFVFAQSNTEKSEISLETGGWRPTTRSLDGDVPTLYLYGNAILIDSSVTLDNLEIIISDLVGNIKYDSYITAYAGTEYVYSIMGLEAGSYKVELKQATKYLYGYFAL